MADESLSEDEAEAPPILHLIPSPLRIAAAWSWRLIVIGIVAMAILSVLATLAPIVIPVAIALLIAAPLERVVTLWQYFRIPRALAAMSIVLGIVVAVLGLAAVASTSVVTSLTTRERRPAAVSTPSPVG